ncbi:HlyD family secretion protein, partial [Acinetobacter nosocomialis]
MLKNNGLFRKEVFDSRKNRFVGNVIVSVPITFKRLCCTNLAYKVYSVL